MANWKEAKTGLSKGSNYDHAKIILSKYEPRTICTKLSFGLYDQAVGSVNMQLWSNL